MHRTWTGFSIGTLAAALLCAVTAFANAEEFAELVEQDDVPAASASPSRSAAAPNRDPQRAAKTKPTLPSLPVPGHPSRGQSGRIGNDSSTEEKLQADQQAAQADEDELPTGLIFADWVHQYRGGAATAEMFYTGEIFNNARGGITTKNATRYRGDQDIVMNFYSEKLGLWKGGQFFIFGQNTHGSTLSRDFIGDSQLYSNLDGTPRPNDFTQVSEYWYRHEWVTKDRPDRSVWFKLGKQDANANFAHTDVGSDFVNSSFGLIPTVLLPTFPNPGYGFCMFAEPSNKLQAGVGVYDGVLPGDDSTIARLGHSGSITLGQVSYNPLLGAAEDLPGAYRLGVWYQSHHFAEITGNGQVFRGNHGYWATIDQMLMRESYEEGDQQGLAAFFQWGWAPHDRNTFESYFGAGLAYRGLIPGRNDDVTGLGVAHAKYSRDLTATTGQTFEEYVELFHKYRINKWTVIQPDMQYISNPSGTGRDALVVGVRFQVLM